MNFLFTIWDIITKLTHHTAAARSMIGYWHDTVVSLSVRLSITKCIRALRVGVEVELLIHFFRHFRCIGCIHRSATIHSEKPNR